MTTSPSTSTWALYENAKARLEALDVEFSDYGKSRICAKAEKGQRMTRLERRLLREYASGIAEQAAWATRLNQMSNDIEAAVDRGDMDEANRMLEQ